MKSSKYDTFWGKICMKLKKLATAIEMHYGPSMDIDNVDYRWVEDRIEYLENQDRLLTKNEMLAANLYWKKYGLHG